MLTKQTFMNLVLNSVATEYTIQQIVIFIKGPLVFQWPSCDCNIGDYELTDWGAVKEAKRLFVTDYNYHTFVQNCKLEVLKF